MPYSGPDAPPTAATSRCPTARSSSPGGVSARQLGEQRVDGPEADHEVVAVVAVAQDRVEPGQVGGVALDDDPAAPQRRPDGGGIDDVVGRGGSAGGHGRPTIVGRARRAATATGRIAAAPARPFIAPLDAVLLSS